MAVIWQKRTKTTLYEVRSAGNSRRLYTNGVFHSQYNLKHSITRGVWDLLMLPAFFQPIEKIRRVLVLGVGGGAVIRLLQTHVKPDHIDAIEIDPVHLTVARRFFGVKSRALNIVRGDAIRWLLDYSGSPYDLIIDDLFCDEHNGDCDRPVALDTQWMSAAANNLYPNGIFIANMHSLDSVKESAYFKDSCVQTNYKTAFQLTMPKYDNRVFVCAKSNLSSAELRENIKHSSQGGSAQLKDINYTIRNLTV